jgi:hypothetical protein
MWALMSAGNWDDSTVDTTEITTAIRWAERRARRLVKRKEILMVSHLAAQLAMSRVE